MKKCSNMIKQILTAIILIAFVSASAREKQGSEALGGDNQKSSTGAKVMAACKPARASHELWVNNVRTIIYTGGDMWWDLFGSGNAYYGVPGNIDRSIMPNSNFAGSIWIGGLDAGGQLKVAAMTYRQTGYDFWPGPLVMATASTDEDVCNDYDQIFHITRKEVEDAVFNQNYSDEVKKWPGNPLDLTKGHDTRLAPFFDFDGNNEYNPAAGDYPYYDIYNTAAKDNLGVCAAKLFGDETLWWVFNDKGDIHTETGGQSIGLEIRAQAFAFKTSDDINNMTFYNYEVINRSSFSLNKTYFTVWTDPDLGYYSDDYVGCDVDQGLGFIYNADGYDETSTGTPGYLDFPAAGGCDFFKGPLADVGDGKDNDYDGLTDEVGETIGMSKFLYYNNNIGSFPVQTTNPALASHFYGYMTGFWKDGSPFTEGGNAYGGSVPTDYCYPGELYPQRTGWNEYDAGNLAGDRRFLQSAGPFTLLPGAVNNVTFGMPWARSPIKNNNLFAVGLLKIADVKAQALFDNCFKLLDGPEAPEMTIQEGNNELLIYLTNKAQSNNYLNGYKEQDITIQAIPGQTASCLANPDKYYTFEGYKVYQLLNSTVSQTDLEDETKAKLVFQCDAENAISRLVNYNFDATVGAEVPKVKVDGNNKGIQTTFKITEDAFATGSNKKLINNKTYYFMAVAYAVNQYATYRPDTDPNSNECENFYGQKRPYLEGRKIKKAAGIPHLFDFEKDGSSVQANYGYGPKITRIEGQGNGGNIMDFTPETEAAIVSTGFVKNPTYQNGRGPISVKVVDPLNIPNSTFTVKFLKLPSVAYTSSTTPQPNPWVSQTTTTNQILNGQKYINTNSALNPDSITWVLTNLSDNKTYIPKKSIRVGEEYYFSEIGLSLNIHQVADPGSLVTGTVGLPAIVHPGELLEATMTFADPTKQWLTGLEDGDDADDENWIRSGGNTAQAPTDYNDYATDPDKVFGKMLGGTWAPYNLCGATKGAVKAGPGFYGKTVLSNDGNDPQDNDSRYLSSVDVVFTPDKSKWTRCVVLEMQDDSLLAEGVNRHFNLREHASVDKQGVAYGAPGCVTAEAALTSTMSMGWFPGYAINIETGERLNMAFGEDSYNYADNGNDMRWNPTYTKDRNTYANAFGGRHYVYVFGHGKDAAYANTMSSSFTAFNTLTTTPIGAGRYDAGKLIYQQMKLSNSNPGSGASASLMHWGTRNVMRDAMWVTVPMLNPGLNDYSFKDPANMPCEARVRIRVSKPYRFGYTTEWSTRVPYASNFIAHNGPVSSSGGWVFGTTPTFLPKDTSSTPQNYDMPMYQFSTDDIYTMIGNNSTAKNALDYIRVVPNPYYAYSKYETSRIDNRVRITNLPSVCTIKIFTMNGTLVRTFKRDVSGQEDEYISTNDTKQSKRSPYLDWDLKNQSGIPIASGLYILHIDAPGVGEKIVKWFGVMRPLDLQNY